MPIINWNKVR